jgi:cyclase
VTDVPPPSLEEVSPGVFAYLQLHGQWGLNNAGFVLAGDGLTVIDSCFTERRSRDFAAAVHRTAGGQAVRTLVNTHHHGDHTHGNYVFGQVAIVGHEKCREEVIAAGLGTKALWPYVDWGEIVVTPPNITFRDRLTLYAGDLEVQLIYVGPAHTTNDIVAWLPGPRVLFTGDVVFNGGTPFVVMGSLSGSLAALDMLRALEPAIVVPGHGPVTNASVFDDTERYLRFVADAARTGYEADVPPLDLARATDLGDFAALHDSERLVANIHRAYAELAGRPPGAPIPLGAVFPDMIAYNGGEVPRCLA